MKKYFIHTITQTSRSIPKLTEVTSCSFADIWRKFTAYKTIRQYYQWHIKPENAEVLTNFIEEPLDYPSSTSLHANEYLCLHVKHYAQDTGFTAEVILYPNFLHPWNVIMVWISRTEKYFISMLDLHWNHSNLISEIKQCSILKDSY